MLNARVSRVLIFAREKVRDVLPDISDYAVEEVRLFLQALIEGTDEKSRTG